MPVTKSATKKMRQDVKRTSQNRVQLGGMRDAVKEFKAAVAKKAENVSTLLSSAFKKLDKAAKKNLLSKNTAARKKSALTKLVNDKQTKKTVETKKKAASAKKTK